MYMYVYVRRHACMCVRALALRACPAHLIFLHLFHFDLQNLAIAIIIQLPETVCVRVRDGGRWVDE